MQVYTLFSGSSGNCVYIKDERTEILIDAGKSAQAIEKALSGIGTSIKSIDAILVTHEHSDHFVGLELLSKKHHIPVHITEKSYKKAVYQGSYVSQCAKVHDTRYELEIGSLTVKSFEIPHDSAQNVGYVIKGSDETLGIATDIGYVTDEIVEALSPCDRVILESNHDKYMLICGKYPEFLKQRILSNGGHLSNEDSSRLACILAKNGVKSITLAHLSKENNTPTLAHDTMREALDLNGYVNVKLAVADPNQALEVK